MPFALDILLSDCLVHNYTLAPSHVLRPFNYCSLPPSLALLVDHVLDCVVLAYILKCRLASVQWRGCEKKISIIIYTAKSLNSRVVGV